MLTRDIAYTSGVSDVAVITGMIVCLLTYQRYIQRSVLVLS